VVPAARLKPADQPSVRRNNLAVVLRELHEHGPTSRAAIATVTGLNKATVSSLVGELIDRGLARDVGTENQRRLGRPATLVELDGRSVVALGLELNVDFIAALATDLAGRPLFQRSRAVDAAGAPRQRVLKTLISLARQALGAVDGRTVVGISIGVPGLVDVDARSVTFAPNLRWHDVDVGDVLSTALGIDVPVSVDNDANLGALAEYRVGQYLGRRNLVYITGQTGIGGGIIVEGRLLRGSMGFSGEVGHMRMSEDGPPCGCGRRGCWEALVGLKPLLRRTLPHCAEALLADHSTGPEAKVAVVVEHAIAGDPVTLAGLSEHGHWLGVGLATLVNLFNPDVIVLGGFFRELAPWIVPVADETLRLEAIAPGAGGCVLAPSTLGFSASALGGAIHAAERVFDDPSGVPYLVAS
jgi:predicted NBD/HSP70 family sugar kinase